MFKIDNARFNFNGKFYVDCFSISEDHPQFEEICEIAEKMKQRVETFKPIYLKEINGKKFVSIQLRGVTKHVVLNDSDRGNTYDLLISAFEKIGSNKKKYLNLYCSSIKLNTKKERSEKKDIGTPVHF